MSEVPEGTIVEAATGAHQQEQRPEASHSESTDKTKAKGVYCLSVGYSVCCCFLYGVWKLLLNMFFL